MHKELPMTHAHWPEFFGIRSKLGAGIFGLIIVGGYFALIPFIWFWKKDSWAVLKEMGPLRYNVTAFLFLMMMSLPIKMFLRVAFNIKYLWVTPWFNV